jgi:predicted AAA+ superfamily ATPase
VGLSAGYLLDTGVACRLLGIATARDLAAHPSWGPLVENWVVTEVIKARRHRGLRTDTLYWWRSHDGLELDLVLERGRSLNTAEIKATISPRPDDAQAQGRFAELAGDRVVGSAVFYVGRDDHRVQQVHFAPWQTIDAVAAAWEPQE